MNLSTFQPPMGSWEVPQESKNMDWPTYNNDDILHPRKKKKFPTIHSEIFKYGLT